MRKFLKEIRILCQKEKFEQALKKIERVESEYQLIEPEYYVYKSICIQLTKNKNYSLPDAEKCLKRALSIDENHINTIIELGWYNLNVKNNAQKGLDYFERALKLIGEHNLSIAVGLIQSSMELNKKYNIENIITQLINKADVLSKIKK